MKQHASLVAPVTTLLTPGTLHVPLTLLGQLRDTDKGRGERILGSG